jgi:ribosomal protein L11 methylase PrmA
VAAFDSDAAAIEATRVNARDNAVALDRAERWDLRHDPPPPAHTMAANLMRPLLLQLGPRLERPHALILSGLLEHEADEVAAAFAPLRQTRKLVEKGWVALLFAT